MTVAIQDTAVQYITIIDTEGPTFTSTPQNIELNCNDEIPMGSPVSGRLLSGNNVRSG